MHINVRSHRSFRLGIVRNRTLISWLVCEVEVISVIKINVIQKLSNEAFSQFGAVQTRYEFVQFDWQFCSGALFDWQFISHFFIHTFSFTLFHEQSFLSCVLSSGFVIQLIVHLADNAWPTTSCATAISNGTSVDDILITCDSSHFTN